MTEPNNEHVSYVCTLQSRPHSPMIKTYKTDPSMSKVAVPWIKVPDHLCSRVDDGHVVGDEVLKGYGWDKAEAAISYGSNFNQDGPWQKHGRFEIWGPTNSGELVELFPGIYDLHTPEKVLELEDITDTGISVEVSNNGKNAFFLTPNEYQLQVIRDRYGEVSDESVIKHFGSMPSMFGMELFFREDSDGNRNLYAMRPTKEGVMDFIALHDDTLYEPVSGELTVSRKDTGYWIGNRGEFAIQLSELLGKTISIIARGEK